MNCRIIEWTSKLIRNEAWQIAKSHVFHPPQACRRHELPGVRKQLRERVIV
jgi:hypothetical protein